jgi:hypothetical protein
MIIRLFHNNEIANKQIQRKHISACLMLVMFFFSVNIKAQNLKPDELRFVRQGVQRMIFDEDQSIPLAKLLPEKIIGFEAMHPITHYIETHANVNIKEGKLFIQSEEETQTGIWFGGFNPFATYTIDLASTKGVGEIGFEFSSADKQQQFFIKVGFKDTNLSGVNISVLKNEEVIDESVSVNLTKQEKIKGKIILQMLGSGLVLYSLDNGLPKVIAQSDFNKYIDLRMKSYINSFQSSLFVKVKQGEVQINKVEMALTTGVGLADIRPITYENGDPMLDQGRLWYTMSIRGRALPHHIQGVFSLDPTVFDIKLEGVILFDRNDGILRNEIASHIFYDRNEKVWQGLTTGFSAYANPEKEKKQLLAVSSKKDPRFGFSVMKAVPFGMVGDIEDPHVIYDSESEKWRMLTCVNQGGYKAIMLESDYWNKDYKQIAGPVTHNSTGTSIHRINGINYCFSGSKEREIFIYTYPDLMEAGTLNMDLPPWTETSGTRVWPNVVELPDGYPFKYVALMMDRFNYPGMKGPNWTYGALYLYHGVEVPSDKPALKAAYHESVPSPTISEIQYGEHERHVIDFWKAESESPTPLVFVIHGGGWQGGSKERLNRFADVQNLLDAGISVAAINYRYVSQAPESETEAPVKTPLYDAARALQFVRYKAEEWNIDKTKIGAAGGSAGACSSLWLLYHNDLADLNSSDRISRESTRLQCAAVIGAQTTLDPKQMKEWTPNSKYGGHAFGLKNFQEFLSERENILPWIKEYSPYELLTADDPQVCLIYSSPPALGKEQKDPTHTSNFGLKLQEKCDSIGVDCEFIYDASVQERALTASQYLIKTLMNTGK